MSTLRGKLVRLAHAHPEFQADLLPLLFTAGEVPEAFKKQWKNKGKDKDDDKGGDDKKDDDKGDDKKDNKPPWLKDKKDK